MIAAPNWILLGAAARNVGKTEYACALISRSAGQVPVVAVKVTTVQERDGACPRGGEGCGVCSSLEGNFCITEEVSQVGDKDTERMKRGGADRVLWLRVLADHLEEGMAALLAEIPAGACVVCESNSARRVLEPGCFLIIHDAGSDEIKASCAAVRSHADREILFDGEGWDVSPECFTFAGQGWSYEEES
ncbi:MAG: hypothetical protein ACYTGH_17950 [Planctomycetota bacterium]|jgi:hypothetical protein